MSEIPRKTPRHKQALDDNARKFLLAPIDPEFLTGNKAYSFLLIVDWLETNEDTEKKVAYKRFDNGGAQIMLITKTTQDGSRSSIKEPINESDYSQLTASSVLHIEKHRYEFDYTQAGTTFSLKYDEYSNKKLCVLEVDGDSEDARNSFDPSNFPARLNEVTGDISYYGYRVANVVKAL